MRPQHHREHDYRGHYLQNPSEVVMRPNRRPHEHHQARNQNLAQCIRHGDRVAERALLEGLEEGDEAFGFCEAEVFVDGDARRVVQDDVAG